MNLWEFLNDLVIRFLIGNLSLLHTFYVEITIGIFVLLFVALYFLLRGPYLEIMAATTIFAGLGLLLFLPGILLYDVLLLHSPITGKEKIIVEGKKQICVWEPEIRKYQVIIQSDGKEYEYRNPSLKVCNKEFKVINPQKLIFEVPNLPCSCFPSYLTRKTAVLYSDGVEVRKFPIWFVNEGESKTALMLYAGILDLIILSFIAIVEAVILRKVWPKLNTLKEVTG